MRRWLVAGGIALVLGLLAMLAAPRLLSWLRPGPPAGLLSASGRIEGRITTLTPKTGAWVMALHVDEGQAVRQGQLLATLDDRAQRERVRAAEEQVDALARKLVAANVQLGMIERQTTLQTEQAAAALRESEARVLSRFRAPYFKVVGCVGGDAELVRWLDGGRASLAIVIPPDFDRRARQGGARFQVISDGSQSMSATIAGAHIAGIAGRYSVDLLEARWAYPMMLLSGAFTPPESMGPLMRYASLVSPVRHYVDFGYQVLFKGNGLAYVCRTWRAS